MAVHTDGVYCVSQCVYHCVHTDRVCCVSQCVYHVFTQTRSVVYLSVCTTVFTQTGSIVYLSVYTTVFTQTGSIVYLSVYTTVFTVCAVMVEVSLWKKRMRRRHQPFPQPVEIHGSLIKVWVSGWVGRSLVPRPSLKSGALSEDSLHAYLAAEDDTSH